MTHSAFERLKRNVLERLRKELPNQLYYHSPEHTLRVLEKAETIALYEGISPRDLMLVQIAALFHDMGFIKSRVNHEEESCLLAKAYLKDEEISGLEMDKICGMIMATKIPQSPTNILEEILADADLEYLGTKDFEHIGNGLYKEMKLTHPDLTEAKWNEIQIHFMEKHAYFTTYGKKYLLATKNAHLNALKAQANGQH